MPLPTPRRSRTPSEFQKRFPDDAARIELLFARRRNHEIRQDVYHVPFKDLVLYVKFTKSFDDFYMLSR